MSDIMDSRKQMISIIVGALCILLVIGLQVFKPAHIDEDTRSSLKTLFAIGAVV